MGKEQSYFIKEISSVNPLDPIKPTKHIDQTGVRDNGNNGHTPNDSPQTNPAEKESSNEYLPQEAPTDGINAHALDIPTELKKSERLSVMKFKSNDQKHIDADIDESLFDTVELLPKTMQTVVTMYLGLNGSTAHVFNDIGPVIGKTNRHASTLFIQAMNILSYLKGDTDVPISHLYKEWADKQTETYRIPYDEYIQFRRAKKALKKTRPSTERSRFKKTYSNKHEPNDEDYDPTNVVGMYIRDVRETPLLTPEEERELTTKMAKGRTFSEGEPGLETVQFTPEAKEAYDHLIRANLRLVMKSAKKFSAWGVPFLDLVNVGNIGLMKGLVLFKPEMGFKVSTYCTWWINQMIRRDISNNGREIRIPVGFGRWVSSMYKKQAELTRDLQREPTNQELADYLGISVDEFEKKLTMSKNTLSLNDPIGDFDQHELGDVIADTKHPIDEEIAHRSDKDYIASLLDRIPPREQSVMKMRYGLYDLYPYTLEEIGRRMGITRERVRQIEDRALKRLRKLPKPQRV